MQSPLTIAEYASQNYNVPHFLHRLVMILSEENSSIIEWCNGKALSFFQYE